MRALKIGWMTFALAAGVLLQAGICQSGGRRPPTPPPSSTRASTRSTRTTRPATRPAESTPVTKAQAVSPRRSSNRSSVRPTKRSSSRKTSPKGSVNHAKSTPVKRFPAGRSYTSPSKAQAPRSTGTAPTTASRTSRTETRSSSRHGIPRDGTPTSKGRYDIAARKPKASPPAGPAPGPPARPDEVLRPRFRYHPTPPAETPESRRRGNSPPVAEPPQDPKDPPPGITVPRRPRFFKPKEGPGSGNGGGNGGEGGNNGNGGNGGENGGGGNGGNGGDGNGSGDGGDDEPPVIIYCYYCGSPWWDCLWCQYWTPMFWWYEGYDTGFWNGYWTPKWNKAFVEFHEHYDLDSDEPPGIYVPPVLVLDPTSVALEYLEEGSKLFYEGAYLEAVHLFRQATLADMDLAPAKFAYAHGLFALGLYDYAAYEIRLGIYLLPGWPEMGGDLSLMYGDPADLDEQYAALMTHLKAWPGDEDALLVLGYVTYFTGDLYLAEKAFERLALSADVDTASTAGIFLDAVERIKAVLRDQDPQGFDAAQDTRTVEEIVRDYGP